MHRQRRRRFANESSPIRPSRRGHEQHEAQQGQYRRGMCREMSPPRPGERRDHFGGGEAARGPHFPGRFLFFLTKNEGSQEEKKNYLGALARAACSHTLHQKKKKSKQAFQNQKNGSHASPGRRCRRSAPLRHGADLFAGAGELVLKERARSRERERDEVD